MLDIGVCRTARHLPPRHLPPATLAPRRHLPPGTYFRNPLFDFKDFLHGLSLGIYLKDSQKSLKSNKGFRRYVPGGKCRQGASVAGGKCLGGKCRAVGGSLYCNRRFGRQEYVRKQEVSRKIAKKIGILADNSQLFRNIGEI